MGARADEWVATPVNSTDRRCATDVALQRAQPPMLLCACVLPPEMHHKYAEPPGKGLATRDASSATDVAMRMRPLMRHMYAEPLEEWTVRPRHDAP